MPESSARSNLRQVLFHLRQVIPDSAAGDTTIPFLITNRHTLQLNPAAPVIIDVVQFDALLDQVKNHNHVDLLICTTCYPTLETAVALYRDAFLTDFYLDDSNEFEEWAEITRQHFRRKALDALDALTTIATRRHSYADTRRYAERQIALDNLHESAYRQLMEILALSGQRAEALACYESYRRLLAQELGMAPSTPTTELVEKIHAGDLRFDRPPTPGVRGYELKEEIGAGAYGVIHRAVQTAVGREVAVKIIRRRYANDPTFIRRFEAEAQMVARLEHPHIVPLYDFWRAEEQMQAAARLRRRAVWLAGALVVAAVLAEVALLFGQQARQNAAAAERSAAESRSIALATGAQAALADHNPDLALGLALAANEIAALPALAQRTLYDVALAPGLARRLDGKHTEPIGDVVFTPDGRFLISSAYDDQIIKWDVASGDVVWRSLNPTGDPNILGMAPDGRLVAAGTEGGVVTLWDVVSGEMVGDLVRRFDGHSSGIMSVTFNSDGAYAASGAQDGALIFWDVAQGDLLRQIQAHQGVLHHLAFTANGDGLWSAAEDGAIYLWRTALDDGFIPEWLAAQRQPLPLTCLQQVQAGLVSTCPAAGD